jgi:serine/threonine-protein kinase
MPSIEARLAEALADRYRIERELGQGGMATVHLAQDIKHDRRVAIKVLRPELAATIGPERFLREIHIAAQLQHPHILPLLDSGEAGGFIYYVMPFVDGESLRDRLARSGELPVPEAVKIITEVVDALSYAHHHGVVHRDIKPDNVMLSGRHALVMDFGVAKAVSAASGRNELTTAGVALGTPAYMAPEQAAADPHLDHRVDIYAVGVLAYELLGGRPPFVGGTPQQVLAAHVTERPEPLAKHRPGMSSLLEQTVMKCLAKRPADRWQTADELLAQLEPLTTPSGGLTPTETRPVTGLSVMHGVPRWLGWALGGALVAGGALAVTLTRRPAAVFTVGKRIAVAVGPEAEAWPAFTPDGRTVVYTSSDRGVRRLHVQQVGGGAALPITTQLADWHCCGALSPDGSRVLFLSPQGLHVVPTLGGQARQVVSGPAWRSLNSGAAVLWGAWSPDGQTIAYTDRDTLFVQDLAQSSRRAVTHGSGTHSPAWSTDGRWIAFVQGNPGFHINGNLAPSAIAVVPAEGGTPIPVTEASALNTSPVWVPGGNALLFISDRDGGRDVYELSLSRSGHPEGSPVRLTTGLSPARIAISADGTRLAWSVYTEESNIWTVPIPARESIPVSRATRITSGAQNIETLAVSTDGRWLYYDSDLRGSSDIWRVPLASGLLAGTPEQLTTDPSAEFSPSVSPDGREVAYHSFRAGNRDIYVMPAAGGPATQLTTNPEHDWNPRWSPDGQAVAFDEQLNPSASLWLLQRRTDGTWQAPRILFGGQRAVLVAWAPDGRSLAFSADSGVLVLDVESRQSRVIAAPGATWWLVWSADGRRIYGTKESLQGLRIQAVPATGGTWRTLVYPDDPDRQYHRYGLAVANGRFYFPLIERKADVWVAELERR